MNDLNFITGEYFQQKADVYIGFADDFEYNPLIRCQTGKFVDLSSFCGNDAWQNPRILFCYGHRLRTFIDKVLFRIQNPFILISHNSDENICGSWPVAILNHPLLEIWYAQNACLLLQSHSKLRLLPIGLANSQWPHGNLQIFRLHTQQQYKGVKKPGSIYFQFKLETNFEKRSKCMSTLLSRLDWLRETGFEAHLQRLAAHEFCICPEGNGVDTHRFWECIYMRVVPIVLHTPFIANLVILNCPMIVLEKWEDLFVILDSHVLNYSHYVDKFSDFLHSFGSIGSIDI